VLWLHLHLSFFHYLIATVGHLLLWNCKKGKEEIFNRALSNVIILINLIFVSNG